MYRDDEADDAFEDEIDLGPVRAPVPYGQPTHVPVRRSSPSFLDELRARGLIKPDESEQSQLESLIDRAVKRAWSQHQEPPRSAPPHTTDVHVELEGEPGYAFGWTGALALLGIGWLLASFAREGK